MTCDVFCLFCARFLSNSPPACQCNQRIIRDSKELQHEAISPPSPPNNSNPRASQPKISNETDAPSRAIHLLQLLGHPLTENEKLTDLQFLSEVMEVQEDIQTCDVAALRQHIKINGARLHHQRNDASAAFASGRISDAKAIVIKMQYVSSRPPPIPSSSASHIFLFTLFRFTGT